MDPAVILDHLLKDNSPLALGFTGATLSIFLWVGFYLLFSKFGWVGSGAAQKKIGQIEETLTKERALREALVVSSAEARQEVIDKMHFSEVKNAQLQEALKAADQRTEFYKNELERERQSVKNWIEELEKITGLEAKIRGIK